MSQPTSRPIIDVHHHFVPRNVFDRLSAQAGGQQRLVTSNISMTLNPTLPDVDAHLGAMERAGVTTSILSQPGLSFLGMEVCQQINDGLAAVMRDSPGSFIGCAHVPFGDGAGRELERCVGDLGLPAIALPTSTGEVYLDDPIVDPIWDIAQRLNLPIILHPNLLPRGAETDYWLDRSVARTTDTTKAAVRIMQNVFCRYPDLVFILPHNGGTLAFLKGRIGMFFDDDAVTRPTELKTYGLTLNQQRDMGLLKIYEERFRRFYADTAGTGAWPQAIKMAKEVFGADRLVLGSDYPLEAKTPDEMAEVLGCIYQIGLTNDEARAVEAGTIQGLLARAKLRQ